MQKLNKVKKCFEQSFLALESKKQIKMTEADYESRVSHN